MTELPGEYISSSYEIEQLFEALVADITDFETIYEKAKKEEPTFYNTSLKKKNIKDSIKPQIHKPKKKIKGRSR